MQGTASTTGISCLCTHTAGLTWSREFCLGAVTQMTGLFFKELFLSSGIVAGIYSGRKWESFLADKRARLMLLLNRSRFSWAIMPSERAMWIYSVHFPHYLKLLEEWLGFWVGRHWLWWWVLPPGNEGGKMKVCLSPKACFTLCFP